MRHPSTVLLFLVWVALSASPARADEDLVEPPDRLAREVAKAFASGGAPAVAKLATDENLRDVDPFRVAERLLLRHARAQRAGASPSSADLKAAAAWADAAKRRPASRDLPALVASWSKLDAAALADLTTLRAAYVALTPLRKERRWAEVARVVAGVREVMERTPWSVTAIDLEAADIVAEVQVARVRSATERNEALAKRCIALGWRRSAASLLLRTGDGRMALGEPEEAARVLDEARRIHEQLDRARDVARVMVAQAQMLREGGEFPRAEALLKEAIGLFEAEEDKPGLLTSWVGLGNLQRMQGKLEASLASQQRALAIAEDLDDAYGAVVAHVNIGVVHGERMAYTKALAQYEKALSLAREKRTHSPYTLDGLRINMAEMYGNQGQGQRALAMYDEVIPRQRSTEAKTHLAMALTGRGHELNKLGRYAEALTDLEEALALRRAHGDPTGVMKTLFALSDACMRLGELGRALRCGMEACAIAKKLGGHVVVGRALLELGAIYVACGKNEEALAHLRQAHEHATQTGSQALIHLAASNLGTALSNLRRHDEALPLLTKGVETARRVHRIPTLIAGLKNVGITLTNAGRAEEALPYFEEALAESERIGERSEAADTLRLICEHEFRRGRYAQAAAAARRAVDLRLAMERGLGAQEVTAARGHTRLAADYGLDATIVHIEKAGLTDERLAQAFWFAEAGRSLALLGGLMNRDALANEEVPEALRTAESQARDDVRRLHSDLVHAAQQDPPDTEHIASLRADLDAAYVRLDEALARVERSRRATAQLVDPRPATLAAVRASLPPDTALLSYQVMRDGQALAFVLTQDRAHLVRLGNTQPVVERTLAWRRLLLTPGTDDRAAASALAETILAPIAEAIDLDGFKRLIVAPDHVLALVPLDALLRAGPNGKRLVETHEVVSVPSATVFAHLESSAAGKGLLALGDPRYPGQGAEALPPALALRGLEGLGPIPATGEEVRAIAALFGDEPKALLLRERATRTGLMEALAASTGRARALHLACHGLLDTERPMLTGLILADGELLSLADVYRMTVPADLVVLSACETGLGQVTDCEGILGLARGFFFAGAPRVVVSNWRVSDETTRDLMVAFYEGMLKQGRAPAAALRAAKLRMIGAGRTHPYHWASFVLWGRAD